MSALLWCLLQFLWLDMTFQSVFTEKFCVAITEIYCQKNLSKQYNLKTTHWKHLFILPTVFCQFYQRLQGMPQMYFFSCIWFRRILVNVKIYSSHERALPSLRNPFCSSTYNFPLNIKSIERLRYTNICINTVAGLYSCIVVDRSYQ